MLSASCSRPDAFHVPSGSAQSPRQDLRLLPFEPAVKNQNSPRTCPSPSTDAVSKIPEEESAIRDLLIVTTWLVLRLGRVWEDGRSQLLLIVLMYLAISVSFDDALATNPFLGELCFLGGLLFAVVTSEALLRGLGIRLGLLFRLPYHLLLAAVLILGAIFRDGFARVLQSLGAVLLVLAASTATLAGPRLLPEAASLVPTLYPLAAALLAFACGYLLARWLCFLAALGSLGVSLLAGGWHLYAFLRPRVVGLDYVLGGLASLLVAGLISFWKTGVPRRWAARRRQRFAQRKCATFEDIPEPRRQE